MIGIKTEKVDEHSPAIKFDNLTKCFGDLVVVNNINFGIHKGELFGLLGPNGAGKSTLINMVVGLATPTKGTAWVFGKNIVDEYRMVHAYIGHVPEDENFDRHFNVRENLVYHAGYFGVPKKKREEKAEELLRMFDLWNKRKARPHRFSSGMRKKLLIARALIQDPDILILDEPTSALDVETRKYIHKYIRDINRKGLTVLLTTHYIEEAEEFCERVAIMDNGNIVALDSPKKLMREGKSDIVEIQFEEKIGDLPKIITRNGYQSRLLDEGKKLQVVVPDGGEAAVDILEKLFQANMRAKSVDVKKASLEDVFIRLTRRK